MARVVDQMLVEVGVDVDNEFILGCKFYPSPDTEQMLDPFHTGGPYRRADTPSSHFTSRLVNNRASSEPPFRAPQAMTLDLVMIYILSYPLPASKQTNSQRKFPTVMQRVCVLSIVRKKNGSD